MREEGPDGENVKEGGEEAEGDGVSEKGRGGKKERKMEIV